MSENLNKFDLYATKNDSNDGNDDETYDFERLEATLEQEINERLEELRFLEEERDKIGNPDALGETVKNVVWEQFIIQISAIAGEDFIKENNGLKLDLSYDAHYQNTKNFESGKIAYHNTVIDYQKRYDDWQSNFQKDKSGNTLKHKTRTGEEATLVPGARKRFDNDRPSGSKEKHTAMDHTVSAAEIIRDAEANAHLSKYEQEKFANSNKNLYEMDASLNASKGDKSTNDWLDNPNSKGQKPEEIFNICKEDDLDMRKKDKEAREEYIKIKQEGEKRSVEAGKKSRKIEAFKIGGKALRAVALQLLADLAKEIIEKLIKWLKNKHKSFTTFVDSLKKAIISFVSKLKEYLIDATNTLVSTIATAIIGPVVETIKKVWTFLKQGWHSLMEAINFINDPSNRDMPISIKVFEVGKIITAGMTAAGALVLGDVIEKGLSTIPPFNVEIPLLGSLSSIIGIFMGSVVVGIAGAIVINVLDEASTEARNEINLEKQLDKGNEVLNKQNKLNELSASKTNNAIKDTSYYIDERHNKIDQMLFDSRTCSNN